MSINYFNRKKNMLETELVYGESFMRWLYTTNSGKALLPLLTRRAVSKLYGFTQSLPFSAKKIPEFIKQYQIEMNQFVEQKYSSFNHFFIRQFKAGQRNFTRASNLMPAACEARYLAFAAVDQHMTFPIKGKHYTAKELLGKKEWSDKFDGGPLLIARLAPVDYHRFHFMDEGVVLDHYRVSGPLHSVNPIALSEYPEILSTNERQVTILKTKNFGEVAMVEVGALCVGAIVQSYEGNKFIRGQEKGYFLFGGSTVAILGCKNSWKPTADLLDYSSRGIETLVQLGDWIATSCD